MNSFQFFDASDYGFVLILLLLATYVLFRMLKAIKQQIAVKQIDTMRRKGLFWIVIGDLCIVVSVVGFILIEKNYEHVIELFRPISIMTAEPIVFILIIFFFVGIVLDVSGINCLKYSSKKPPQV